MYNIGNLTPSPLKKDGKVKVSFKISLSNEIFYECTLTVHDHS